ncbi:hypothetical protein P3T36_003616 [Kitasatospora sp. MAP12-15]|uniref:hypothetical protein n=1 Tax=unclassified Kitasatospora TaxID=2633591 RepID=UPI0024767B3B|nr:hypothetical protein [Kitasatospora sp. MAP12-44]MDH6112206.1 hypothetical protein [Kitasatospora sp. MAP12-44]
MTSELKSLPDPPAERQPAHQVEVTERGSFASAVCGCGWYAPARRSRDMARRDAAGHVADPGR